MPKPDILALPYVRSSEFSPEVPKFGAGVYTLGIRMVGSSRLACLDGEYRKPPCRGFASGHLVVHHSDFDSLAATG